MIRPAFFAIAVFVYCLWNASDLAELFLIRGWRTTAATALCIWLFAGFIYWYLKRGKAHINYNLLIAAVFFSLIGTMGELHIFQHFGLMLAFASLLPWSKGLIPWMMGSISWFPALEWVASYINFGAITTMRLTIAVASSLWLILYAKKRETINEPK